MSNSLVIRTSDRLAFKECRRKWNWSSSSRGNLESDSSAAPLWIGSGFHFAVEDIHGYKHFPTGKDAFLAYVDACKKTRSITLPETYKDDTVLSCDMLDYYEHYWLRNRDPLKTYIVDGAPQCEIKFQIPIPINDPAIQKHHGIILPDDWPWDEVIYQGTIDRVVIDEFGRLWILDFKTAANITHLHYALDQQITSYCWAASLIYDKPIAGFIYQQHRKKLPAPPRLLQSGTYSVAKNQVTDYNQYRDALINMYTDTAKAPPQHREFLLHLNQQEFEHSNLFIHREFVDRSEAFCKTEEYNILLEAVDMGNTELSLYPNPTKDCSWKCSTFEQSCILMSESLDWEDTLKAMTQPREKENDSWRKNLQLPPK